MRDPIVNVDAFYFLPTRLQNACTPVLLVSNYLEDTVKVVNQTR